MRDDFGALFSRSWLCWIYSAWLFGALGGTLRLSVPDSFVRLSQPSPSGNDSAARTNAVVPRYRTFMEFTSHGGGKRQCCCPHDSLETTPHANFRDSSIRYIRIWKNGNGDAIPNIGSLGVSRQVKIRRPPKFFGNVLQANPMGTNACVEPSGRDVLLSNAFREAGSGSYRRHLCMNGGARVSERDRGTSAERGCFPELARTSL